MKARYVTACSVLTVLLLLTCTLAQFHPSGSPAAADASTPSSLDGTPVVVPIPEPADTGETSSDQAADSDELSEQFGIGDIPDYSGAAYVEVNGGSPYFADSELKAESFEQYSPLDSLGRCGPAIACIGIDLMSTEERGPIGMIRPSGWHTVRYDDLIEDRYLYNRCHLIGYQLTGENANMRNLITGTRYLNTEGMLPIENKVAGYIRRTGNHVLYRATPIFDGDDLVAHGVLIEAMSVEDAGVGITLCAFAFNVQPGITIDYATGDSTRAEAAVTTPEPVADGYIGNKKSLVFHLPTCPNLPAEKNRVLFETREEALAAGYRACGNCHP